MRNLKIIILSLSLFIQGGCIDSKEGTLGVSATVKESKARGVFLLSCQPSIRQITIDSINYAIDEVWIEKRWRYKKSNSNNTSLNATLDKLQMKISFTNDIDEYESTWYLGDKKGLMFAKSNNAALMSSIKELPNGNLKIPIRKGNLYDRVEGQIVGYLEFPPAGITSEKKEIN